MTEQEAELLAAKLTKIWVPENAIGPIEWCLDRQIFYFSVGLLPLVKVTVAIFNTTGTTVLLDYDCLTTVCDQGLMNQTHHDSLRPVDPESLEGSVNQLMGYFRRGCWLSDCPIECSAHEQLQWTHWLREQTVAPTTSSGSNKDVAWEARRVVAAFGASKFREIPYYGSRRAFCAQVDNDHLYWELTKQGKLRRLAVGNQEMTEKWEIYFDRHGDCEHEDMWRFTRHNSYDKMMSDALFCLDFKSPYTEAALCHEFDSWEQTVLRERMPREFWPQSWLGRPIEDEGYDHSFNPWSHSGYGY